MNIRVIVGIGVVLLVVGLMLLLKSEDPELKLVEATLWGAADSVVMGDEEALATFIAADYSDRLGQDQRGVVRRAIQEVEHIPDVRIEFEGLKIDIDESSRRATATFRPLLLGEVDPSLKKTPKLNFDQGRRLIIRMRKQDGLYLITRADMGYAFGAALK